jgi:hypothetical protein
MKEITKEKISLPPCDIHKSKVVVQVMQSTSIKFTKFSMVLVTNAGNISLTNWCQDGKTTFRATPTVSTMHLQLLKNNDDFLLCKVLDLPRMLVEKGHAYGKVLQNQKYL